MTDENSEVSLRAYIDRRLEDRDRWLTAELEGRDKAVLTAAQDNDRRLDHMNEYREQLNEERGHYVPREVYEQYHNLLRERVGVLEQWRANIMGRAVGLAVVGTLIVAFLTAIVSHVFG